MVGLVVVSHSRVLADALTQLIQQVCPKPIPIAAAGGVGADRHEFGSDATEVAQSIASVYSADGVLVLMDLGGAILSAEMALELIQEDMRSNVRLCAGPLVEGAIAAGVHIGLGSNLDTVFEEARQALVPKAHVVILTIHDSVAYRMDATEAGVSAYILKEEMQAQLVPTLKALLANGG